MRRNKDNLSLQKQAGNQLNDVRNRYSLEKELKGEVRLIQQLLRKRGISVF
jgi:sensor domain CHASE-containing protein